MVKPVTPPVVIRSGWCAGLSFQLSRALMEAGYQSKPQARAAVLDGRLSPELTSGLSQSHYTTLCAWLGVEPQGGKPTDGEIAAAVALLERAGYVVELTKRAPAFDA